MVEDARDEEEVDFVWGGGTNGCGANPLLCSRRKQLMIKKTTTNDASDMV